MAPFAVCFIGSSYPIPSDAFTCMDDTHWVLDVSSTVRPDHWALKEVALFLAAPGALAACAALGLYVRVGDSGWLYRGCVHAGHPSEVMPLQWPAPGACGELPQLPQPGAAQLGVALEPAAELAAKEGSRQGDRLDYARRVGQDLYRFLASFATGATRSGDAIVMPANALDRWFVRFEHKFKVDPDFLTRRAVSD